MMTRVTKRVAAEAAGRLSKKPRVHIIQPTQTAVSEDDETQRFFRFMERRHPRPQVATKKLQEITGTDPDEASDSNGDDAQLVAQALQMPSALNLQEAETTPPDSPAISVISTEAFEDTSADASRSSENGIPAQELQHPFTPSTSQDNVVPDPHTPIGPQLFDISRRTTELVVDATEDQLARLPATKRAVTRARMLADFTIFMHKAIGEFANRLE